MGQLWSWITKSSNQTDNQYLRHWSIHTNAYLLVFGHKHKLPIFVLTTTKLITLPLVHVHRVMLHVSITAQTMSVSKGFQICALHVYKPVRNFATIPSVQAWTPLANSQARPQHGIQTRSRPAHYRVDHIMVSKFVHVRVHTKNICQCCACMLEVWCHNRTWRAHARRARENSDPWPCLLI